MFHLTTELGISSVDSVIDYNKWVAIVLWASVRTIFAKQNWISSSENMLQHPLCEKGGLGEKREKKCRKQVQI